MMYGWKKQCGQLGSGCDIGGHNSPVRKKLLGQILKSSSGDTGHTNLRAQFFCEVSEERVMANEVEGERSNMRDG